MMTDSLIAFLTARYDEAEAVATAASPAPWHLNDEGDEVIAVDDITVAEAFALSSNQQRATAAYIARYDPAWALRDIAAKRAIVGQQTSDHAPVEMAYGLCCRTCVDWQDDEGMHEFGIAIPHQWPCRVARAVTASWSDHPDYRQEWAP